MRNCEIRWVPELVRRELLLGLHGMFLSCQNELLEVLDLRMTPHKLSFKLAIACSAFLLRNLVIYPAVGRASRGALVPNIEANEFF